MTNNLADMGAYDLLIDIPFMLTVLAIQISMKFVKKAILKDVFDKRN